MADERSVRQRVCVVTDSTAAGCDGGNDDGLLVVPLTVTVDERDYRDGQDLSSGELVAMLGAGAFASTSQPNAADFAAAYRTAADRGFDRIVSIHISGELSGTAQVATLASEQSPIPVMVVDSRTTGAALGAAVAAALLRASAGASAYEVGQVALGVANGSRTVFMVESIEHLRRGGRLSRPAAAVGAVLGVRPVLAVREGRIELEHIARTRAAAIRRIVDACVKHEARAGEPEIFVQHFGDEDLGRLIAQRIEEQRDEEQAGRSIRVVDAGCVLGAHVGPGMIGATLVDHAF